MFVLPPFDFRVGPKTPPRLAILTPFYKKTPTNSGQNTSNTQRRTDYTSKGVKEKFKEASFNEDKIIYYRQKSTQKG
jgi:hypothetical protein